LKFTPLPPPSDRHAVEWEADEALFDILALRLLDALPLNTGDDDDDDNDDDGTEAPSASMVFSCLMASQIHASSSSSSNSTLGSNGAENLDFGELCARVRAALLRGGASDRDIALQHALFGGTLRASHQVLQRAWQQAVNRCAADSRHSETHPTRNNGDSNDATESTLTGVKGERSGVHSLPVASLARLLGSRRFARQSLELPSALPPDVASAIAHAIAHPPAADSIIPSTGDNEEQHSATDATNKQEVDVSAQQFKAWCAPPRPVASLVDTLLGMAQNHFGGDLDAM
jgi:hypothetical protein